MTYTDRLAAYFTAYPSVWIDGKVLAHIAGAYAWRSRVADLRTKRGMVIENRQRRLKNGPVISEYRYVPASVTPEPHKETRGHDLNDFTLR